MLFAFALKTMPRCGRYLDTKRKYILFSLYFSGDGNDVVPNFDWILPKEKEAEAPVSKRRAKIQSELLDQ